MVLNPFKFPKLFTDSTFYKWLILIQNNISHHKNDYREHTILAVNQGIGQQKNTVKLKLG